MYSTLDPFHTVNISPARALVPEVVTYLKNPEVYEDVGNEATVDVDPEVTAAIPEYCISEAEICKDPVMIVLPLTSSFAFGDVVPIPTFPEADTNNLLTPIRRSLTAPEADTINDPVTITC